jgi:hypothetical protein
MKTDIDDNAEGVKGEKTSTVRLNPRQLRFCELVVQGHSYAAAYRIAYLKPKLSPEVAGEHGWRVTQRRGVKERIEVLRKQSKAKTLLTLNDRLEILAGIAQDPQASRGEKVRAVEAYSKISGDQAPEAHTLSNPDGSPIIPANLGIPIERVPVEKRIEMIRAARARAASPS